MVDKSQYDALGHHCGYAFIVVMGELVIKAISVGT